MDGRPAWIRLVSLGTAALGLLATLAGPTPYHWRPGPHDRWRWPTDMSTVDRFRADVVVLDPFLAGEAEVSGLHAHRRAAVCQLRAGVWESGRPDAARLDATLIGDSAPAGARWLDVRRVAELSDAISDRMALCAGKGFDGVVLADLDGYARPTGFPLTAGDQLRFNAATVALARRHGLRVAVVATRWTPVPSTVDITVSPPSVSGASADGAGSAGTSTTTGS
jgi:hypothetical protein